MSKDIVEIESLIKDFLNINSFKERVSPKMFDKDISKIYNYAKINLSYKGTVPKENNKVQYVKIVNNLLKTLGYRLKSYRDGRNELLYYNIERIEDSEEENDQDDQIDCSQSKEIKRLQQLLDEERKRRIKMEQQLKVIRETLSS